MPYHKRTMRFKCGQTVCLLSKIADESGWFDEGDFLKIEAILYDGLVLEDRKGHSVFKYGFEDLVIIHTTQDILS